MDKLPIEITRKTYEYDPTYRELFDNVLVSLRVHCFIYRRKECFKPYNQCFCYCVVCRTYLRFCRQLYFLPGDMEEDELENVIPIIQ